MKKIKVYVSGAISGLSREAYMEAFAQCERRLRQQAVSSGQPVTIVNPTRLAPCRHPWLYRLIGYRLCLAYDLWHLRRCTHITMTATDWTRSRGARLERRKARQWGITEIKTPSPDYRREG